MNEQALKDRLKVIAKEKNLTFGEVWKRLTLERFLVRLSKSEHFDKFIFKGGLLLSYYVDLGRETKDADFLAKDFEVTQEVIESHIKDICAINIDDGFIFTFRDIAQLEQPHMNYPGYRANLDLAGYTMKDALQLDLGVGDIVEPTTKTIPLLNTKKGALYEQSIKLKSYPLETIFAEKLETIISKGTANSRMKDFYDLHLLCRNPELIEISNLKFAITETFARRGTTISLPVSFTIEEYKMLETLWTLFLNQLGEHSAGLEIHRTLQATVDGINEWIRSSNII